MLVQIGNYLDVKRGASLSREFYSERGKFIRLTLGNFDYPNKGFKENTSKKDIYFIGDIKQKFILKKGDIITPLTEQVSGLLGETAWIPEDNKYIQSGDVGLVIPNERVLDKKFCYYLLQSPIIKGQLGAGAQQTKIRHTSPDKIKDCVAIIPTKENQIKIGKILYDIDSQINRNETVVKRLQVLSQAIFNKFFALENDVVSLVEFPYVKILKPGIMKFDGNKHYVATAEVEGEKLNYDAPLIEYATRENRANMQPVKNSVWFAKLKNSIKHIYVSSEDDLLIHDYVFSTGFCGIKCDEIAFEYLINYLNLPYFEKEKDILSHGATMEGVNNEDLKSFKIHLPSKEKLSLFHDKTKNIHCQISKLNQMTYQLVCLKEKLLPLLINGQLQ